MERIVFQSSPLPARPSRLQISHMTVRELIERLHTFPEEGIVLVQREEGGDLWLDDDFNLKVQIQRPSIRRHGEWIEDKPPAPSGAKRTAIIIT